MPFWNKKSSKGSTTKSNAASNNTTDADIAASLGIDPSMFEDINDNNGDVHDVANELALLQAGCDIRKHKKSNPSTVDGKNVSIVEAMLTEGDDDVGDDIAFTEDDMNDPELLNALHELRGHGGVEEYDNRSILMLESEEVNVAVMENAASASVEGYIETVSVSMDAEFCKEESHVITGGDDMESWKRETEAKIADAKRRAIALKRDGNKQAAIVALRESKVLLAQLESALSCPRSDVKKGEILESESNVVAAPPVETAPVMEALAGKSPYVNNPKKQSVDLVKEQDKRKEHATIDLVELRILQYKKAALASKKAGNMSEAKKMLAIAKRMTPLLEHLQVGIPVDISLIPSPPSLESIVVDPVASNLDVSEKRMEINKDDVSCTSTEDVYDMLLKTLSDQISACHDRAKMHKERGNNPQALEFVRLKKKYEQDIIECQAAQSRGDPVPCTIWEEHTTEMISSFTDIHDGHLQVTVLRAMGLHCPSLTKIEDICPYLVISLGYPTDSHQKVTTGTFSGASPSIQFTHNFSIDRKSRKFASFVKRRCVEIELFHSRGLLLRDRSLGRVLLKMSELNDQCEVLSVVDVLDERRKPTGGRLEVMLRMREPLAGSKTVTYVDRWLTIDSVASANAAAIARRKSSTNSSISNSTVPRVMEVPHMTISTVDGGDLHQSRPVKSSERSRSPSRSPCRSPSPNMVNEEENPNSIDIVVSSSVLDAELKELDDIIVQHRSRRSAIPEYVEDRKLQIQVKLSILTTQVQSGQLTLEGYLAIVKDRASKDKTLAIECKKNGHLDWAKQALRRFKIQSEEILSLEAEL